ncbi:MAG: HDOD domain-containing protein [Phycisphaerales bacterium JB063]
MPIHDALLERVLKSPRLPSLPTVAIEIIELVQKDEVGMDEISDRIRMDSALSSKILKTVNSTLYSQSGTISSINQAVVVLGLNSVKTLALGFSLVGELKSEGGEGFDHIKFWKQSLFSATTAKIICEMVGIVQAEEVFMAALLQDIGMLVLQEVLGSEYGAILTQAKGDHEQLLKLERQSLNGDHAEIGGALAESWGLPPVLVEPIRYHETPNDAPVSVRQLARAVAAGKYCAALLTDPDEVRHSKACMDCLREWFGMEPERCRDVLDSAHEQATEVKHLFELPTGDLGKPEEIMRRAQQAMETVALQNAERAKVLEEANRSLALEINRDALTGVSNRRALDEKIVEQFAKANMVSPLCVMFMDIDHFKKFNDEHGHAKGDEVLVAFAKQLEQSLGDRGVVYRYGGEEFALLLPASGLYASSSIAEQIRSDVERKVRLRDADGQELMITTSIGVAIHDGRHFRSADQLVRFADRGVYAAKEDGRNCVRVFVPKTDFSASAA